MKCPKCNKPMKPAYNWLGKPTWVCEYCKITWLPRVKSMSGRTSSCPAVSAPQKEILVKTKARVMEMEEL